MTTSDVQATRAALPSTAERRIVTVMFCDLVGSTALTVGRDPEDVRDVLSAYHRRATAIIEAFGGVVAQYLGDGMVAYFGYPTAGENDAGRAIRAGLDLLGLVQEEVVEAVRLRVRVGIATGLVVIGDLMRTAGADEHPIIGETPNLAARLQSFASPGSLVIDDATQRLVDQLFEYADLGRQSLKGFPEPVQVWGVLGESSVESRFEATHSRAGLTALVNRVEEFAILQQLWQCVEGGQGQAVLLTGEPGIGKSRLGLALRQLITDARATSLRYYCSPYHSNSSLYPLVSHIERAARIVPSGSPAAKLDQLEKLIAPITPDLASVMPLIAALLSIPVAGRYAPIQLTAQRQKERTIEVLEAQLVQLAAKQPVLMMFEDLQWADTSTLEFLDGLVERVRDIPVLLLMTCRPEFEPRWEQHPRVTKVAIGRLSRRECETLLKAVVDRAHLTEEVREQILLRSDGVPLFVEEVAKTALETGHLGAENVSGSLIGMWPDAPVPRALYASLMARLDQLAPWRKIVQTAAAIGRQFSYELMSALFPQDRLLLDEGLPRLIHAGLIVGRGVPPDAEYTFKHALLQEVAYASLLRPERRAIHGRIARTLVANFPDTVSSQPELLATHYASAGLTSPAIMYWQKAGERAQLRSANTEAIGDFNRALALLQSMPHSRQRDQQELDLQFHLGAVLTAAKGFASPEVAVAYERARKLCRQSDDTEQRFSVLRGLWVYNLVQARFRDADDLAAEMMTLARTGHSDGYELEAHRALGMTLLWRGAFVPARAQLRQGTDIYDPKQHHKHAFRYGNDPGIACMVHEGFALWMLGYPDQAVAKTEAAIALARKLGHPFCLAQSLIYHAFVLQCRREAPLVLRAAGEAKALAVEYGFPFWLAEAGIMEGWALGAEGKVAEGLDQLRRGIGDFLATGARMDRPRWLALLAEALGKSGQPQAGRVAVIEALGVVDETQECFYEARLRHLKGELVLQLGEHDATAGAEACFQSALATARRQQAKSWELRAAVSLGRLWLEQSRRQDARDLLTPIYGWFTEGHGTADLEDARELLEALA